MKKSALSASSITLFGSTEVYGEVSPEPTGETLPEDIDGDEQYKSDNGNTGVVNCTVPSSRPSTSWTLNPEFTNNLHVSWPTIAGGSIYMGVETFGNTPSALLSLSDDGVVDWAIETNTRATPPTVADDYVFTGSDGVYAATRAGDLVWKAETDFGVTSPPKVHDGSVYVTDQSRVYSFATADGERNWSAERGPGRIVPPAISDSRIFTVGNDRDAGRGVVTAFTTGGRQAWRTTVDATVGAEPVFTHGSVYVGDLDGTVYSLSASSGDVKWSTDVGGEHITSPSVSNSSVFVASSDGTVSGLHRETGRMQWTRTSDAAINSPLTVASESVLVPEEGGDLVAVTPGGSERWRFSLDTRDIFGSAVPAGSGELIVGAAGSGEPVDVLSIK